MDNTMMMGIAGGVVVVGGLIWWFSGSSESNEPKSTGEIAKLLEEQGYKIKEIEFEKGFYEVEAYLNGKEFDIKLDRTGKILSIKEDD